MSNAKTVPYKCLRCEAEGSYNGSLRHGEQPVPKCKEHGEMTEVKRV